MRYTLSILVFLTFSLFAANISQETTENTPPVPYYVFDHPTKALSIAAKFLPENPIIVEAGAFDGTESCFLASFWPKGHIHSFEPIQQLFKMVQKNTEHKNNISIYPIALGDFCGQKIINLSVFPSDRNKIALSSSFCPPKDHTLYYDPIFEGTEIVSMLTLDAWAMQHKIEKIDMLWLDMQGYELAALKAAPKLLSTISVILTEIEFSELYEGQPLYREFKAWLGNQGFVLIGGNFGFPKIANQHFGDGLFVKKDKLQQ